MRAGPLARVGPWPTAWRGDSHARSADPWDRAHDPYRHPRWPGPGSPTDGPHPSSRHPAARAPGGAGAHNDTSPGGAARGGVPRRAATREPGPVRAPHDSAAVKRGAWPGWARVHAPARRRRPEQDGMDDLIAALIRGCHLGSGIGLFGILAFAGVVGAPACRAAEAAGGASVEPLARQWLHGARWSGLAVAATSLLDLGRQATVVTENGWMASLAPPILGAVLTQGVCLAFPDPSIASSFSAKSPRRSVRPVWRSWRFPLTRPRASASNPPRGLSPSPWSTRVQRRSRRATGCSRAVGRRR